MSDGSPAENIPQEPARQMPPPAAPYPVAGAYAPRPRTNGLAVTSLVFGILSIVMCPLSGIVGLITGLKARGDILRSQGAETGDGLALGGIITSIIGLVFVGLAVLAIFAVTFLGQKASSKFSSVGSAVAG